MRNDDDRTKGISGGGWTPEPLVLQRPPTRQVFATAARALPQLSDVSAIPVASDPVDGKVNASEASTDVPVFVEPVEPVEPTEAVEAAELAEHTDAIAPIDLLESSEPSESSEPVDAVITVVLPALTDATVEPEHPKRRSGRDSQPVATREAARAAHIAASAKTTAVIEPAVAQGVPSESFENSATVATAALGQPTTRAARRAEASREFATEFDVQTPKAEAVPSVPPVLSPTPSESVAPVNASSGAAPGSGLGEAVSAGRRRPTVTEALARTEELLKRKASDSGVAEAETASVAGPEATVEPEKDPIVAVGKPAESSKKAAKGNRSAAKPWRARVDTAALDSAETDPATMTTPPLTRREARETGEVKRVRTRADLTVGSALVGPGEVAALKKTRRSQRIIDVALVVVMVLLVLCAAILVYLMVSGAFDTAFGSTIVSEFSAQSTSGSIGDSAAMMNS